MLVGQAGYAAQAQLSLGEVADGVHGFADQPLALPVAMHPIAYVRLPVFPVELMQAAGADEAAAVLQEQQHGQPLASQIIDPALAAEGFRDIDRGFLHRPEHGGGKGAQRFQRGADGGI
nr:hypothetical protein [Chromobacterium violaceum]